MHAHMFGLFEKHLPKRLQFESIDNVVVQSKPVFRYCILFLSLFLLFCSLLFLSVSLVTVFYRICCIFGSHRMQVRVRDESRNVVISYIRDALSNTIQRGSEFRMERKNVPGNRYRVTAVMSYSSFTSSSENLIRKKFLCAAVSTWK